MLIAKRKRSASAAYLGIAILAVRNSEEFKTPGLVHAHSAAMSIESCPLRSVSDGLDRTQIENNSEFRVEL
jgi:hypothetical protein